MTKTTTYIVAAEQNKDEQLTSSISLQNILKQAQALKLNCKTFTITPLKAGWNSQLAPDHYRSGNGPLEAIDAAIQQLTKKEIDIAIIQGEDFLKSAYTPELRHSLMEIYPTISLPQAYTKLAQKWCNINNIELHEFITIAALLFDNYHTTYSARTKLPQPEQKWFNFITPLFRGVDCANPVVDFSGRIVLTSLAIAQQLKCPQLIAIEGIATGIINGTGIEAINEIAQYSHLKQVISAASTMAAVDFVELFKNKQAYLEVYSCFPIVPLAFLFASGIATNTPEMKVVIQNYPLTITGGMNLAKAAWNQPVLRAIIAMYHKLLQEPSIKFAGIHGNGGLGERQGFLILQH